MRCRCWKGSRTRPTPSACNRVRRPRLGRSPLSMDGRVEEALAAARRDVGIIETSDDEHDLMLSLEELAACQAATATSKAHWRTADKSQYTLWAIHQRRTTQLDTGLGSGSGHGAGPHEPPSSGLGSGTLG